MMMIAPCKSSPYIVVGSAAISIIASVIDVIDRIFMSIDLVGVIDTGILQSLSTNVKYYFIFCENKFLALRNLSLYNLLNHNQ